MLSDERLIPIMDGQPQRCQERTEVYSRVCGFFRPVQQWNKGKKEEFKDRREYVIAPENEEAPRPEGGGQGAS